MAMGLMPGTILKVMCQAPFGGPVKVAIEDGEVSLRMEDLLKLTKETHKQ